MLLYFLTANDIIRFLWFSDRRGIPYSALNIYKKGDFPYLGLKEGAEILFKGETIENLIGYIQKANRKEDVLILEKASESEKVKAAVAEKLKSFQS